MPAISEKSASYPVDHRPAHLDIKGITGSRAMLAHSPCGEMVSTAFQAASAIA
ncbi:hypothetical protein GZL_06908 [Streptomyces sp. 769]|nr:hypothetical protein GZL_06908 [Streptomyces sp. 769]